MTMHDLIEKLKERPKTVGEHLDEQKREWLASLRKGARIEWIRPNPVSN